MTNAPKLKVVLVHGNPGHGKSHLAGMLREDYDYRRITVDDVYVRFIRDRYPDLYLPRLRQFIGPHWDCMIIPGMRCHWIEDIIRPWSQHLFDVIEEELRSFPRIVVEGYLVEPALTELKPKLEKKATLCIVKAEEKKYFVDNKEILVEAIAR